jgi:putative CocE/NonD family hydrolase
MKTAIIKTGPHDFGAFTCGTGAMSSDMITWADITAKMAAGAGPISMLWYMRSQKERIRPVFDAVPLLDAVETYLGGGTPEWLRYTITHPEQTDPFWKPLQQHGALERANIPILLVTGWHDLLMPQVMEQYSKLAERGCNVAFTIGPWSHLGAQRTTLAETFDWLDKHVADRQDARTAPVRVFVTGAEEWRDLAKWPPATSAYELCLAADKSLSATAPPADAPQSTFTFDPADPTPAVGVPQLFDTGGKREPDTSLATRSDVLTFITEPLDQDVEVCGKPSVSLHHSSDSPHVDLLVLLSEVDSTGASYSISEKYMRLDPSRDQGPGTALGLNLHDCAHRFRKGNRIRLLIAGGSHPRYIRNLGTGDNPGTGSTMRPVSHTIRHDASAVSKLVLPVCRKE